MLSFTAISIFLLANLGGVASASLQRKRFTVNTDAKQQSDAFGWNRPFGAERNLLDQYDVVVDGSAASMSMLMSMSMSMSMSMDIGGLVLSKINTLVSQGQITSDTNPKVTEILSDEDSRSCPSLASDLNEYTISFAYRLITSISTDVTSSMEVIDEGILDGCAAGLMSCESTSRKLATPLRSEERRLDSDFYLKKIAVDSAISNEHTCTSPENGECNVVISTLTVSTESGSVSEDVVKSKTLSVVQKIMSAFPADGVQVSYEPMETLSLLPSKTTNESHKEEDSSDMDTGVRVSAKNTDQVQAPSGSASFGSAATGALVAGAVLGVLGAAFVFKQRRASSSSEEYFGEDIPETPDLA